MDGVNAGAANRELQGGAWEMLTGNISAGSH